MYVNNIKTQLTMSCMLLISVYFHSRCLDNFSLNAKADILNLIYDYFIIFYFLTQSKYLFAIIEI